MLDPRLTPNQTRTEEDAYLIQPITAELIDRLRLPLFGRVSAQRLRSHLNVCPDLALVVKGTSNIGVARPWRHRDDVYELVDLTVCAHSRQLLDGLTGRIAERGASLMVLDFDLYSTTQGLFHQAGFTLLDEIIEMSAPLPRPEQVEPTLAASYREAGDISELLEMDHLTFPWLWRNSEREMSYYLSQPAVNVFIARLDGQPAGYVGYTLNNHSGYIDRIAVLPQHQGKGLGSDMMAWTLQRLEGVGVTDVQLTTQRDNEPSQRMYRRFGFRETGWGYAIYGKRLVETEAGG